MKVWVYECHPNLVIDRAASTWRSQAKPMSPIAIDASATLKMSQGTTSMKSVTWPKTSRSTRLPTTPASNIRDLVRLMDEEMDGVAAEQRERLENIEAELIEVRRRLDRVWHIIENVGNQHKWDCDNLYRASLARV